MEMPIVSPSWSLWREAIFLNVLERNAVRKVASGESFIYGVESNSEVNLEDQSQCVVVMSRGKRERLRVRESLDG